MDSFAHTDGAQDALRRQSQSNAGQLPGATLSQHANPGVSALRTLPAALHAQELVMQRVRRIVTRSGGGFRGKFASRKLGRMVHYQSLLERDAILHLEYHPAVLAYQEQPSEETYYDAEHNPRAYFPDFLVVLVGTAAFNIEVKPHEKLQTAKVRDKLGRVAQRMAEQGRTFRVWTQHEIRREPLFTNLRRLHELRRPSLQAAAVEPLVRAARADAVSFELNELIERFGSEAEVLRLLAHGVFQTNLEQPLTPASRVWTQWNQENLDGAFSL